MKVVLMKMLFLDLWLSHMRSVVHNINFAESRITGKVRAVMFAVFICLWLMLASGKNIITFV